MALRIRIPPLLDVAIVKDDSEMASLNNEPAVSRRLSGTGDWIHRLVWRKMYKTLSVGNSGVLPVFEARDNAARAATQKEIERRLTALASEPRPFDRDAITALGRYVAGVDPECPVGVTVQQVVGRLLDSSYLATTESYDAARVVAAVLSACPLAALRVLWWTWSGRLDASKRLIWDLARNDPVVIHATAIAMHNIVDSLARMRAAMRADGPWLSTPAEAAAGAVVAPPAVLRECVIKPKAPRPFRRRTLLIFRLKKMHAGTASNDLAFSRKEWSECPAHALVPRLLEEVWTAAVQERSAQRYRRRRSLVTRLLIGPANAVFAWLNRRVPWYRLPKWIAFANLWALRNVLRERNLYDTSLLPSSGPAPLPPWDANVLRWRTADGSFNDLQDPSMGRAGTRFGRNVPLGCTYPDTATLLEPNPRLVSRVLLTRQKFLPAPSLNVLASAWIQFMVHDWFSHEDSDPKAPDPILIPVDPADPWTGPRPMLISRTPPDQTRCDNPPVGPPTFLNAVTHWWDASQLYGSDLPTQLLVRSRHDGKLALDARGRIPLDPVKGIEITGFNKNWWLGLSLLHHLFTLEHNAICDRLRAEYPAWNDEQLFQTARLVNAALITKVHDLEWVPAVLANPAVKDGLHASWWGLLGKWVATTLGRLPNSEMLSGVPGSVTDHHTAPYAITEEFVSVYRMHAFMMPEQFDVYSVNSGGLLTTLPFTGILGPGSTGTRNKFDMVDLLYSFGRNLPGALTLGNYSPTLQQFQPPSGPGPLIDLAAVDILRDRERGVPRYNQFRQLLHLPPVRSFEELSPEWADRLREVYGTVDRVDLMVGLFAEAPPPGFGFSDTTFRIFLLMNSRRLKSDRFFTTDFTPAVYTQTGLDWIDDNDMRSILLRHYPVLDRAIRDRSNVFTPWS